MPEEMNTIEKATFQDLIDGNACIGPDGGIWYPSGPADVPVANIFMALVNEARSHRCKEEQCRDRELVWTEEPPKVEGWYWLDEDPKPPVLLTVVPFGPDGNMRIRGYTEMRRVDKIMGRWLAPSTCPRRTKNDRHYQD